MYGASITRPDGGLWLSPEFTPANLINKGVMSASKGAVFRTSIPSGRSCFFFVRSSNRANMMFLHQQNRGYNELKLHQLSGKPGTVTVYAFSDMVLPHSGHGIAMYNKKGEMVFHGEMKPLDARVIKVGIQFSMDLGYPCAIMPAMVGCYNYRRTKYDRPTYVTLTGATGNTIYSGKWYSGNITRDISKVYTDKVLVIDISKYG